MILQSLREATRPEHERLEACVDLLERPWSLSFYRHVLEKFYGFYVALEPALFAFPQWAQLGLDVEARRKLPLLERDLTYLGLSSQEIRALPHCGIGPKPKDFAEALGCAYVLEGSTLGGQIISRHLRHKLEITPEAGCAYFYSYGEEIGPMWQQFTHLLNAAPLNDGQLEVTIASARQTFSSLEDWISDIL